MAPDVNILEDNTSVYVWKGGQVCNDCETEVNECETFSPCYNNATCEDLIAGYRCHCLPGYNGKCDRRLYSN
ncbi:hypothetical protein EB796_005552 [Bugula neritina]|uniref:EGF-like domain-containing protein n=1 Tax=Bugula neritina TaxID=10212 RepID=A0A7J7KDY5_BUGNE|nr:hypothetical protein EB796_005552 [Bugula neritina]